MVTFGIFSKAAFPDKARFKHSSSEMRALSVTDISSCSLYPPPMPLDRLQCNQGGLREPNMRLERF